MTEKDKLLWKKNAKPVLLAHLQKAAGYPNCSGRDIMEQVGPMWAELVSNGLVLEGMTFQMFVVSCQKKYVDHEMGRILGL